MQKVEFWGLIEGARRDGGGSLKRQCQLIRRDLEAGSVDRLLGFRRQWCEAEERIFCWPVWDAASVLLGFVSDDFFTDVRAWIISHGEETVDRIAADPDGLVLLAHDRRSVESGEAEELGMLVWTAWQTLTGDCGDGLPPDPDPRNGLTGDRIDVRDGRAVRARFPRLAALTAQDRLPGRSPEPSRAAVCPAATAAGPHDTVHGGTRAGPLPVCGGATLGHGGDGRIRPPPEVMPRDETVGCRYRRRR